MDSFLLCVTFNCSFDSPVFKARFVWKCFHSTCTAFGIAFCFICLYFSAFITHTVSTMSHLHLAKTAKYSLSFGFFFLFGKRSHFCQQRPLESMLLCQSRAISALSQTHPKPIPSCSPSLPGWGTLWPLGLAFPGVPAGKFSSLLNSQPSPWCLWWGPICGFWVLVFFLCI